MPRNKMLLLCSIRFSPVIHFLFHWGFPALDLTSMFLQFARIIIFDKDFIYHIVCERIMLKWNLVQKLWWSVCTPVFQNCTCSSISATDEGGVVLGTQTLEQKFRHLKSMHVGTM